MVQSSLPLGQGVFRRSYGDYPPVNLKNRFFEEDPTNQVEGSALLTRPGVALEDAIGAGPVRKIATSRGAFSDDAFIVSGDTLWRYDGTNKTAISGTIQGSPDAEPEIEIITGPGFEFLFIADGQLLQYYPGPSFATGSLTLTPDTPPDIDTQEVEIAGVHYKWAASISGSPTGTSGDPFQVLVGTDDEESLAHLVLAINATGTAGVDYSSTLTDRNVSVEATASDATTVSLQARERGSDGNALTTSVVSGAHLAFGGATLSGGGAESLFGVAVPAGAGIVSLAQLGKHLVAVEANSDRCYFILPGEVTMSALQSFTAEQKSDELVGVRAIGSRLLLLGERSIEGWYLTGIPPATGDTFLPIDGLDFDIGVRAGTFTVIRDELIFVGEDNVAYILGGSLRRISDHGIEETIRIARAAELGAS